MQGDSQGGYTRTVWAAGFHKVLGVTRDPARPDRFYFVGMPNTSLAGVYASSATTPNATALLAVTPLMGNGLGCHNATGLLYVTAEGNELPGKHSTGTVYRVDPATGAVDTLSLDGAPVSEWSPDGLFIDQARQLLYVGELLSANILVWDLDPRLPAPKFLGVLPGFKGFLDDFCLTDGGDAILGCDWSGDALVAFPALPANGTFAPRVVVPKSAGVHSPTSARWGWSANPGDPFPSTALFVTEGHIVDYKAPLNRLLRIDFD